MSILATVDVTVRVKVMASDEAAAKAQARSSVARGMNSDDRFVEVKIVASEYAGGK